MRLESIMKVSRLLVWLMVSALVMGTHACKGGEEEEEPVEEKPIQTEEEVKCDNECYFAMDGQCDDGGPGSSSSYCNFGTDCEDCGKRVVIKIKR
ncbi:MAG: hypothetical protein R2813_00755 [Flavobacteriales bacterium]